MATIDLMGIRKQYGRTIALDDVSINVNDGEFFCLLGPSGAGKTTTLKVVAGLEESQAGKVRLGGNDVTDVEPTHRNLAMCFESYALYPQLNVFDNLASPLRSPRHKLSAKEVRDRVGKIAELLTIGQLLERNVGQLSNGQRQRVALGRVLVRPAAAYLLDEPLSHLDAKLRATMRAELKAISGADGTTTIYVTHDYVEALSLADRIGILDRGRIRQVGTPEEVWTQPADLFVAQAFGKPRINLVDGRLDTDGFASTDGTMTIPLAVPANGKAVLREIVLGIRPRDLGLHRGAGDVPSQHVKVEGSVYVLEHLGRQTEVTVRVGESLISLVVSRQESHGLAPDDKVAVTIDPAKVHVFEADEAGRRVAA